MKSVLLLYPHQLYPLNDLPSVDTVLLIEDPLYFGMDQEFPRRMHKQKLILHRASMRRYAEEVLWPAGLKVDYVDLDVFMKSGDILDRVAKAEQLFVIDPTDDILTKRLLQARRERENLPNLTFLPSPNFYLKELEVRQYFGERHKHAFEDFYQWLRERFDVLIDDKYKPVGGKWMVDVPHHKLPADITLPSFSVFGDNKFVAEATAWADEHFPDNPGSSDFMWPTNHDEASAWLADFVEHRIDNFGTYEEALDSRSPWLFHSLLQSSLNSGLLKPQDVVSAAIERHKARPVPLPSLESFIRQVLGWREYVRGLYLNQQVPMKGQNVFKQQRKLTSAWYNGTTGLPPLDDMIKKLQNHAYAHQAERNMIAGNLMIVCEIQPEQMYKWFSELFIDAYDWVVVPNIYGISQFVENSSVVNKAYIGPSNDVLDVSDYTRGVWSDTWDGLFWRFVDKNQALLGKNPRMRVMVQRLKQLDPDRKRIILYRAEDFLNQHTTL